MMTFTVSLFSVTRMKIDSENHESPKGIKLDFDKILEIALKGVRRASIFMGFGVNAALDEQFKSFQLTHLTNLQLVPTEVSDKTLQHYKDEFRTWIEAAGLREISEAFVNYLDVLHQQCLIVEAAQKKAPTENIPEKQKKFAAEGLPNKLNNLQQQFSIAPKKPNYIVSIGHARNCLVHRLGRVGPEDLQEKKELEVAWLGIDLFIEAPSGEKHYLNENPKEGIHLPDGGDLKMQFLERKRTFSLGSRLSLSTRDLAEICWFYRYEAINIRDSAVAFAKKAGVPVLSSDPNKSGEV
jgi:hypothetical protein